MPKSFFAPLRQPLEPTTAGRSGGWRQANRARTRKSKPNSKHARVTAALRHLSLWGSGLQTATKLWWHMGGMRLDGTDNYACLRLSQIGKMEDGGKHSQKNLLQMMAYDLGFDEFITALGHDGSIRDLILPSTFLRLLSRKPTAFRRHLGARVVEVEEFWRQLLISARGQLLRRSHPQLVGKSPSDLKHCIPLSLHEDAGPFSKRRSTNIINMGSLLGSGKDIEVRYQLCSYLKTTGDPYDSGAAGWEAIFDDLVYLATGIDEDGNAFACVDDIDWGGILIFGCADMEQLCLPWGLPGYHEEEPCFECDCNRSDKPYTSLVRVSRLRKLGLLPMFSETTFRSRCNSVHPLVHSIYFNSQFPKLDPMHVIDHKGKGRLRSSLSLD